MTENKKQKIYEKNWFAIGLIVIVTFIVYANSLKNEFVYEDYDQIVNNDFIKSWTNIPKILKSDIWMTTADPEKSMYYRPLFLLSLLFDYHVWGLNPLGFHITNLLLHILNSILVYFTICLILNNKKVALLAGLFFSIHPINTENVSYISGRDYLLAFLFYLLSFLMFILLTRNKKRIYYQIGSLFLFFLALLTKEIAIMLPFVLILYDYCFIYTKKRRKNLYSMINLYLPYFAVIGIYFLIRKTVLGALAYNIPYHGGSLYATFLTMSRVFIHYIKLLILPVNLCLEYVFPISKTLFGKNLSIISIIILLAILIIAIRIYKSSKEISFSIFWFFITLIPVSQIIPTWFYIAERYLYFPSFGFYLLLAILIAKILEYQKKLLILIPFLLIFYEVKTIQRNNDWKDNLTLWTKTVKQCPDSFRAHLNLGLIYGKNGRIDMAIDEFTNALKTNWNMSEDRKKVYNRIKAHISLGNCYGKKELYWKAAEEYKRALKIYPDNFLAHKNLGLAYFGLGKYDMAISEVETAQRIKPNDKDSLFLLSVIKANKKVKENK